MTLTNGSEDDGKCGRLAKGGNREAILDDNTKRIAIITKEVNLEPGETTDDKDPIILKGGRVLTNNEDIVINNNAEIIQIDKNGGSSLRTEISTEVTPGNFDPGNESTHEVDDNSAEQFIITPPLGETKQIILYTILSISVLGILVTGIILIKKYVLK